MRRLSTLLMALALLGSQSGFAQTQATLSSIPVTSTLAPQQNSSNASGGTRTISGVVLSDKDELVPNVTVIARTASGDERTTKSKADGSFTLEVPAEPLTVRFFGNNIALQTRTITATEASDNLQIKVAFVVAPINESVVIVSSSLDPTIGRRNNVIYNNTLFERDDQLVETLNAGINVGQHEGGGKSLEIRRFGYNLDHGGVGGGLKFLVDDIQQNGQSQGHGQGYLGQLKSLTPELVQGVDILNGPFSAQYGDFSGLGVVHIRLKESLPDELTMRFQAGAFGNRRMFLAYSPKIGHADSFIAYEKSHLDGPFINPGRYNRDNVTGNYTSHLNENEAIGFKMNLGRNYFFSSGQIPLDLVTAGELDRFGFLDPTTGGRIRTGVFGAYYRKEWANGTIFKADGFLTRSLFDLLSNFTLFLNDRVNGDGIQQIDSRLQQGGNVQYIRPYRLFGRQAVFMAGGYELASQARVTLYKQKERVPFETVTLAHVNVANTAGYVQQGTDFMHGHLHLELGLRYDYFHFNVDDKINTDFSGTRGSGRVQPKVNIAYTPSDRTPATFYFNYGRGINSQDARGIVRNGITSLPTPDVNRGTPGQSVGSGVGPPVATTDFYQTGAAYNRKRFSFSTDLFLIDHSNEQVYIPDDGTIEFAGPSRSSGYEFKASAQLTHHLAVNAGMTQVMNAFFRGTFPRVYVDSSPHTVGNAGFTLANYHGFNGSIQYRHVGNYRLDGEDAAIRASGLDVVDFSMNKRVRRWVDLNFSIDNLFNKRYLETQNYFASRVSPEAEAVTRIHATPGFPFGAAVGVTFHLFGKQ
ncbi:MAG: TonB-dependent receptor [Pyrinomonadaceae bacterium]